MSDFIADVERQYEVYCKIAEEYGFIDLNAKRNGFLCTTKSNEFNAGWIAFTGAVAAVRDEQQVKIDELQKRVDVVGESIESFFDNQVGTPTQREYCNFIAEIKQALRGEHE